MEILLILIILCLLGGKSGGEDGNALGKGLVALWEFLEELDWKVLSGIVIGLAIILGIWARSWEITLWMIGFPAVILSTYHLYWKWELSKLDKANERLNKALAKVDQELNGFEKDLAIRLKELQHKKTKILKAITQKIENNLKGLEK